MPRLKLPPHSRHATGQGRIVVDGVSHYTGKYGTPESEAKARRILAEIVANGGKPLTRPREITVGYIADGYHEWATRRFVKRGKPTGYVETIRIVMDSWIALYGDRPASEFGPKAFRVLRQTWIDAPTKKGTLRMRSTINQYAGPIREAMRWAVAEELIPAEYHLRIKAVPDLDARDGGPVAPRKLSAPPDRVEAARDILPAVVRDILALIECAGVRPSEACQVTVEDIDRSDPEVWVYRVTPEWNKTEHHERSRVVYLGPRAQAILLPRIERYGSGPLFRPSRGPRRHEAYKAKSLATVLGLCLKTHGIEGFAANQLRHSALTNIHRAIGLEHARDVAGHADSRTTLIYIDPEAANADQRERAKKAAREMG